MSTSSHPILLAALDLDGTLLNSNGEVSPCTQKVLSEASDRGVVVIPLQAVRWPACRRWWRNSPGCIMPLLPTARRSGISAATRWAMSTAGMPTPQSMRRASRSASSGGASRWKKAREVYEAFQGLPGGAEPLQRAGALLRDMAQQRFFDERFARLAAVKGTEAIQPNDGRFTILRDQSEWMSRHATRWRSSACSSIRRKRRSSILPRFTAIEGVEVVQGAPDNIEVTAAGVNKGESLLALADHLGIPREATLAVGDSENDRACWKRQARRRDGKRHGAHPKIGRHRQRKRQRPRRRGRDLCPSGALRSTASAFCAMYTSSYAKHCAC